MLKDVEIVWNIHVCFCLDFEHTGYRKPSVTLLRFTLTVNIFFC